MKRTAHLVLERRVAAGRSVRIRHKHLKLDQKNIDTARRFFGAKTDQEAVGRALEAVAIEADLEKALRKVQGIGGMTDPWRPKR